MLRSLFVLPAFLLALPASASAASPDSMRARVDVSLTNVPGLQYGRLALVGAGGSTAHLLAYRYVEKTWWQGRQTGGIRFINDWSGETFLNMDKAGHFMSGLFLAEMSAGIYRWAGFNPNTSTVLGSLTSFGELLFVEWRDGHFDQWGFSIPDLTADALGAAVPVLHTFFPATQAVRFKMSYLPSSQLRDRVSRQEQGRPFVDSMADDYEGMTFWMTVDIKRMFGLRQFTAWPDGLGLAVGLGATGMHGANAKSRGPNRGYPNLPEAQSEILLALDYHAPDLPGEGAVWGRVKRFLRFVHLPAPAVRVYPEWTFYFLYL
jgi:hypothetical protein